MSAAVWLAGGRLEVAGECSAELLERIAGGQPVVLTLEGRPVAVVLDVESWIEVEQMDAAHGDFHAVTNDTAA
ncbi:MAG: type II toxin-antitoxin system prevent-host-death family antitoxin [Actinomycetota bacterium]|nr:type II toxin-antitoxin system prevent-host-death family antitoxin [Actinomycetota bacterium]